MKTEVRIAYILAIACAACAPQPNQKIGDGGFLSGQTCSTPCFWNITPGITTELQARDILANKGISQACTDWQSPAILPVPAGRGIACPLAGKGKLDSIDVWMDMESDVVISVMFRPSVRITLQEAIERYGQPSLVRTFSLGTPEHPNVDATLYFDSIHTSLDLSQQVGQFIEIKPTAPISGIRYYSPEEYAATIKLSNDLGAPLGDGPVPWKGYGQY